MIGGSVPFINDSIKRYLIFFYIFAHAKKSGFRMVLLQHIQHPGSYFRNGAIIESEVDFFFIRILSPQRITKSLLHYFIRTDRVVGHFRDPGAGYLLIIFLFKLLNFPSKKTPHFFVRRCKFIAAWAALHHYPAAAGTA